MTHPVPIQDPVERAFRAGIERQEFLVPFCEACQRPHWYPRPFCPHCGHSAVALRPACGEGEIYALTLLHAKAQPPQCIAYIRLREGITVLSSVIDAQISRAHIGQPVTLVFQSGAEGDKRAVFRLTVQ